MGLFSLFRMFTLPKRTILRLNHTFDSNLLVYLIVYFKFASSFNLFLFVTFRTWFRIEFMFINIYFKFVFSYNSFLFDPYCFTLTWKDSFTTFIYDLSFFSLELILPSPKSSHSIWWFSFDDLACVRTSIVHSLFIKSFYVLCWILSLSMTMVFVFLALAPTVNELRVP